MSVGVFGLEGGISEISGKAVIGSVETGSLEMVGGYWGCEDCVDEGVGEDEVGLEPSSLPGVGGNVVELLEDDLFGIS
jgi:hypothetical protein